MSHPMVCPACDEDFAIELKCMSYSGGTIDSSGDPNSDLQLYGTCPECGFKVVAVFDYNKDYSDLMMRDENDDTHRRIYVQEKTWVPKWATHEDAHKVEELTEARK